MKCGTCLLWHRDAEDRARAHRLKAERDLLRQRAIDEVAAHHKGATAQTAAFDVDGEMNRHLAPIKFLIALLVLAFAAPARAWEFRDNPDRFPSIGLRVDNLSLGGDRTETIINSAGREVPYRRSDETETGWKGGADVRLPVTQSLTFTFAYDHVETDDYFTRHNELGGDLYKEHKAMSGYSYGVGVRLYLNK